MNWQPIETAPIQPFNAEKRFTPHTPRLLLWVRAFCVIGEYGYTQKGKGRWQSNGRLIEPTHWMPLPEGPKE